MTHGLHLPHGSAYDPPMAGEGTLYPLGLFTPHRLADMIAPWITARMSRIRFVAAIAAASSALEALRDRVAVDGVTPSYMAFEWLLVEALARDQQRPPSATLARARNREGPLRVGAKWTAPSRPSTIAQSR